MRRGDYLNVASHVISDEDFINIAWKFSKFIQNIVVLSDSKISNNVSDLISKKYANCLFLDDIDAFTAHCLMRYASALIISNSQFSLSAALLNKNALVALPTQWFGGTDRNLEKNINAQCRFQFLN